MLLKTSPPNCPGPQRGAQLKVFIVELEQNKIYDFGTCTFQAPSTERNWEWVHTLAEQLAACRSQLQTFGCRAGNLNTFPAFPNLKHLILDVSNGSLQNGVGTLAALLSLETLHLRGYEIRNGKSEPSFEWPPIDLASLSRLLRLALVDITPESILVPSSCAVHVTLFGNYTGSHPVWSAICNDALRSISLFGASFEVMIQTPQDIPRAMREASCLDFVYISSLKVWSCEKLPSALARVRKLTISSECIMLCVPAKVQWQCMVLCGWDQLDVTFEDLDAFVKVPMNFRFASLKPFGRSWLPLDNAILQNKPGWVLMAKQLEYRCECTDESKCAYCEDNI